VGKPRHSTICIQLYSSLAEAYLHLTLQQNMSTLVAVMVLLVVKSAKQRYEPSTRVRELLEIFRRMVNDSIRIGLETDTVSLKRLSHFAYKHLKTYRSHSVYRLTAISKAAGILASRKKSIRRGHPTKTPYLSKLVLVSCYGFKIRNGRLEIPVSRGKRLRVP